ncbi:MAG: response regulator [Planctomycetota bacterium]|nr:MAG: response regulator [Planctomycetota bacterium]
MNRIQGDGTGDRLEKIQWIGGSPIWELDGRELEALRGLAEHAQDSDPGRLPLKLIPEYRKFRQDFFCLEKGSQRIRQAQIFFDQCLDSGISAHQVFQLLVQDFSHWKPGDLDGNPVLPSALHKRILQDLVALVQWQAEKGRMGGSIEWTPELSVSDLFLGIFSTVCSTEKLIDSYQAVLGRICKDLGFPAATLELKDGKGFLIERATFGLRSPLLVERDLNRLGELRRRCLDSRAVQTSSCRSDIPEEWFMGRQAVPLEGISMVPLVAGDQAIGLVTAGLEKNAGAGSSRSQLLSELAPYLAAFLAGRKEQEELAESKGQFWRIFEDNQAIKLLIDPQDGRIVEANTAALRFYGYHREQITGMKIYDINMLSPEEVQQRMAEVESGTRSNFVFPHRLASKEIRQMEVHSGVVLLQGHEYLLSILHDVTEKLRMEEKLRQTQKLEAVGRLSAGVAHNFNNLLTIISAHSEILREELEMKGLGISDLLEIERASERASILVRKLLVFSRKQVLQPNYLHVNRALMEMDSMLRPLIGEDVMLELELGEDLGPIYMDSGNFEQIIMNLAVNSRDAMPDGGRLFIRTQVREPEKFVMADLEGEGPLLEITVRDTGCGMEHEILGQVFDPFFTTKGVEEGTGLGLFFVREMVKNDGGRVEIFSRKDVGTEVRVLLPMYEEKAPQKKAPILPLEELSTSARLMLVEDENDLRILLESVLRRKGFEVLSARDGVEALRKCRNLETPIEMLVTDVIMPRMDGAQLARQLQRQFPELKVLFLSGYMEDAMLRRGISTASAAFLQKPFSPDTLVRKIVEVLKAD